MTLSLKFYFFIDIYENEGRIASNESRVIKKHDFGRASWSSGSDLKNFSNMSLSGVEVRMDKNVYGDYLKYAR